MTGRTTRAIRDDCGTAATIVLFPLFATLVFVFVQAAFWQQDRQLTYAAADRASVAVALYGSDTAAAKSDAVARLERSGICDVEVSITGDATATVVVISATAPGILIGTSSTVTARSVTPTEGFRAP
jgi:hypothetical protein